MIQRLSVIIVLYLSFCSSKPNVISMGSRQRYLANNNSDSTKQNPASDKITANNSASIVPNKDPSKIISVPTSQPSSIFKAPSQDIVTEGPTADNHHENHYNDKNIGGSQNINKEIVEEDAYALSAAKYSFYAILSFLLFYGLIQIIKRRSSSSGAPSSITPQYTPVATAENTLELEDDDLEDDESYFSNQNIELARRSPPQP